MTSPADEGIEVDVEWIDPTPPKRRGRRMPTPPLPRPSIASLIDDAVEEGKNYFQAQIELFVMKAKRAAKQAAGSVVMILIAVVLALYLIGWAFHTGEVALRLAVPDWAAALIMTGIILLLVIIFGAIGAVLALGAKNDAPDPKAMVQEDIQTLKADFTQAKEGLDK